MPTYTFFLSVNKEIFYEQVTRNATHEATALFLIQRSTHFRRVEWSFVRIEPITTDAKIRTPPILSSRPV